MPKVLIVSDSHGLTAELDQIKEKHQTDYMFHCGDAELDMDAAELEGFIKVAGNCDFDTRFPDEQLAEMEGVKFFITHGHLYNVKANLMTLSYRAQENNAQVVCFGHTHIAGAKKIGDLLFINPGSIRLPRNRPESTYAIMDWKTKDDVHVFFYTMNGEQVDELTYDTSL
ncbi:YfcE family phosphodiesterase [Virgibacillus dakarensis]|uniref:Phosphoesterase n=1 Tax=Lentibacillus populi TaxID=1827502 RepID=A0A9W5TTT3_9BACI|nr:MULTISPECIES: metallophosphoesterase [Bacillaceae]MBT2215175.1 metallophosphoesterase [Virgibacillus dakarensis]MTW84227.1 YfcE family phosphodiesterase [Virgibacillus dakarensis]GGB28016.1 phosphoesterase [Lentibacillus populi]